MTDELEQRLSDTIGAIATIGEPRSNGRNEAIRGAHVRQRRRIIGSGLGAIVLLCAVAGVVFSSMFGGTPEERSEVVLPDLSTPASVDTADTPEGAFDFNGDDTDHVSDESAASEPSEATSDQSPAENSPSGLPASSESRGAGMIDAIPTPTRTGTQTEATEAPTQPTAAPTTMPTRAALPTAAPTRTTSVSPAAPPPAAPAVRFVPPPVAPTVRFVPPTATPRAAPPAPPAAPTPVVPTVRFVPPTATPRAAPTETPSQSMPATVGTMPSSAAAPAVAPPTTLAAATTPNANDVTQEGTTIDQAPPAVPPPPEAMVAASPGFVLPTDNACPTGTVPVDDDDDGQLERCTTTALEEVVPLPVTSPTTASALVPGATPAPTATATADSPTSLPTEIPTPTPAAQATTPPTTVAIVPPVITCGPGAVAIDTDNDGSIDACIAGG